MDDLTGRPIALIGFMGAGKTTLGSIGAARLGLAYADADALAAEKAGMAVAEVFTRFGEGAFRALEAKVLLQAAFENGVPRQGDGQKGGGPGKAMLLSCGGGVCEGAENRAILHSRFFTVFLDCPFEVCMARVAGTPRPLVQSLSREGMEALYHRRLPLYKAAAHARLSTAGEIGPCADALVSLLAGIR